MERLTEKRESGAWPKKGWTDEAIAECLDRLADYEDTGLELEEIELLAKQRDLYVDVCGELPLKRIRELAQADQEGKFPKYTIGDTVYDRFGCAWEATGVDIRAQTTIALCGILRRSPVKRPHYGGSRNENSNLFLDA